MKVSYILLAFSVAISLCGGCAKAPQEAPEQVLRIVNGREISVTASCSDDGASPASHSESHNTSYEGSRVNFTCGSTVKVNWNESGETFTAFAGAGTSPAMLFTQTAGTATFTGTVDTGWPDVTNIYAIYPAQDIQTGSARSVAVDVSVQTGSGLDAGNTLMYAKSTLEEISSSGLHFCHIPAVVEVKLRFPRALEQQAQQLAFSSSTLPVSGTIDLTQTTPAVTVTSSGGTVTMSDPYIRFVEGSATDAWTYLYLLPGVTITDNIRVEAWVKDCYYSGTLDVGSGVAVKPGRIYTMEPITLTEADQPDLYVATYGSASNSGRSWNTATTLTHALQRARAGATIHIAQGTYTPDTAMTYDTNAGGTAQNGFYIARNISILGGYHADPRSSGTDRDIVNRKATISGGGTAYHTVFIAASKYEEGQVYLEGLQITGGNCNGLSTHYITRYYNTDAGGTNYPLSIPSNMGGGIAAMCANISLNYVDIVSNSGDRATGIYAVNCKVNITEGQISSNSCERHGAAFFHATPSYNASLTMSACPIKHNTASAANASSNPDPGESYAAGLCVRSDGGGMTMDIDNIWFHENSGVFGSALRISYVGDADITDCSFTSNKGGAIYVDHYKTEADFAGVPKSGTEVMFNSVLIQNNSSDYIGSGIYARNFHDVTGVPLNLYVANSTIIYNTGPAKVNLVRSGNSSSSSETHGYFANTTIAGNSAGYASALCLFSDTGSGRNVWGQLISCTVMSNSFTNASSGSAVMVETDRTYLESYNSIIVANMLGGDGSWDGISTRTDISNPTGNGQVRLYRTFADTHFYGAKYYGGTNQLAPMGTNIRAQIGRLDKAFDFRSMTNGLAVDATNGQRDNYTIRMRGDARVNSALAEGYSSGDLAGLARGKMTADILTHDQCGVSREGKRVMGACVTPSGDPIPLNEVYFCGDNMVILIYAHNKPAWGDSYFSDTQYMTGSSPYHKAGAIAYFWLWDATAGSHPSLVNKAKEFMTNISECKPVEFGSKLLITSSYDWVFVLDMDQLDAETGSFGKVIFSTRDCNSAHSAALLPGNLLAVACSNTAALGDSYFQNVNRPDNKPNESKILVYQLPNSNQSPITSTASGNPQPVSYTELWGAHGVVWSEKYQTLYAISYNLMAFYKLNGSPPQLVADASRGGFKALDNVGWHDLTVVDEDTLLISGAGSYLYHLDTDTIEATPLPVSGVPFNKSANYNPYTRAMWRTRAPNLSGQHGYPADASEGCNETWATKYISWFNDAYNSGAGGGTISTGPGYDMYKCRVLNW